LGFKCIHCEPPHFPGNLPGCFLEKYCYPTFILVGFIPRTFTLASIQLLDVNEVVIITTILGEPQHPNFVMIITSRLYELHKEN
jgi:hypothetical protein